MILKERRQYNIIERVGALHSSTDINIANLETSPAVSLTVKIYTFINLYAHLRSLTLFRDIKMLCTGKTKSYSGLHEIGDEHIYILI